MADKHPYTSSSTGITQVVQQLRRSFPAVVTSETLKKLGIAPNNESYVLNMLKFLGVLDGESKKVPSAAGVFSKHDHTEFQQGFADLIENAYRELFELHAQGAWTLDSNKLISFFRTHDETSDIVGRRQATTFQTLARLAGKLSEEATSPSPPRPSTPLRSSKTAKKAAATTESHATKLPTPPAAPSGNFSGDQGPSGVALTVRIEINLPAGGDQSTYDAIFKSIRENLMNGNGA